MQTYFEVSKGVLLKADVAIRNLDFDPELPYSQEILFTHPQKICPYDGTKMELDWRTKGKKK